MINDIDAMRGRGAKMKIPLPKNWREIVAAIDGHKSKTQLVQVFSVSSSNIINRWQREDKEFAAAIAPIIRKPTKTKKKLMRRVGAMTADEIDDLLLESSSLDPRSIDEIVVLKMRDAIRQLRREKRATLSELNRLRHGQHLRRSGRTISVHASGIMPD